MRRYMLYRHKMYDDADNNDAYYDESDANLLSEVQVFTTITT
jgi:hypothetical protein